MAHIKDIIFENLHVYTQFMTVIVLLCSFFSNFSDIYAGNNEGSKAIAKLCHDYG